MSCWKSLLASICLILVVADAKQIQLGQENKDCRQEKHRPQLHFSIETNWANDPNGLVYYDGEYHLHYQHNPFNPVWGPMHWAHSVSTDLVHWTDLPIALYPDDLGQIFSGSAVADERNSSGLQVDPDVAPIVAIFTHAGASQQQSMAYSLNRGRDYTKFEGNPIIPNPNIPDFRDPKVIAYDGGKWIVLLAAGQKIMFYGSENLVDWSYLSEFGEDPFQGGHGGVWECPDLVKIGSTWVLLVSINPGGPNGGSVTQYFVGNFDGTQFHSEQMDPLWMDWGMDNYAGITFYNDPKARSVLIGWMNNWNYAEVIPTGNFRGQMTLPRVLDLAQVDGKVRLVSSLAEEFEALRNPNQFYDLPETRDIEPNSIWALSEEISFQSQLLEVDLNFDKRGLVGVSSLVICFLNSLDQELCVGYDHGVEGGHEIFLNREKTGDLSAISESFSARPTAARETVDEVMSFKIVLDVSAIELFVDGGLTVLTALFYPDEPLTSIQIRHHADSQDSRLVFLGGSVRGLNSIYDC